MPESWQQTDRIVMAVQTAEIRQTSVRTGPTLFLSCNLVNIARGQCLVEIRLGRAGGRLKRLRLAKRLAKQDDKKENQSLSHQSASYLMVTGTGTNSADLRFS